MLSVVIPTLNAAERLPALITTLKSVADEVVVADGGSTDGTRNLAQHEGAVVINSAPGRGGQLAAGAKAAHGDWLMFLHADSTMGQGWQDAVRGLIDDPFGEHWAGYFRLAFDDESHQARRLEQLVAWRSRALGLPYGDQGLLLHRSLYDRVGGYADMELMEDVALVRKIGRRWLKPLDAAIITSAERYRRDGWLRRSSRNMVCLALHFVNAPNRWISKIYYS